METVVIKIGTGCNVKDGGDINIRNIEKIVEDVLELRTKGKQAVIFSSGSLGLGWRDVCDEKPKDKILRIVCTAVGQIPLAGAYAGIFRKYGLIIGQLLFTYEELRNSKEHVRQAIKACLDVGIIPFVNYNDPLNTAEIFADNDNFAAKVAVLIGAKRLLILTDRVNGLLDKQGKLVPVIRLKEIGGHIENLCSVKKGDSNGSMEVKLLAGKTMVENGGLCVIGNIRCNAYDLLYKEVCNCTTII